MYLFDSSVIIEILNGNQTIIAKYVDLPLVTINLIYGEVYYYSLKHSISPKEFRAMFFEFLEYTQEDIEEAMELLLERKRAIKDFSFVDAMVYAVARKNQFILVTKDKGFLGLPNVYLITSEN